MSNLYNCKKCTRKLIAEESTPHKCRELIDLKMDGNKLLVTDGESWYPLNLRSTDTQHSQNNRRRHRTLKRVVANMEKSKIDSPYCLECYTELHYYESTESE